MISVITLQSLYPVAAESEVELPDVEFVSSCRPLGDPLCWRRGRDTEETGADAVPYDEVTLCQHP